MDSEKRSYAKCTTSGRFVSREVVVKLLAHSVDAVNDDHAHAPTPLVVREFTEGTSGVPRERFVVTFLEGNGLGFAFTPCTPLPIIMHPFAMHHVALHPAARSFATRCMLPCTPLLAALQPAALCNTDRRHATGWPLPCSGQSIALHPGRYPLPSNPCHALRCFAPVEMWVAT